MLYNYLKYYFTQIYILKIVKGLNELEEIWLESNNIVVFDLNSLVGLNKLLKVCIFNNPISKYFPEKLQKICETNSKCVVKINDPCNSPNTIQTDFVTSTVSFTNNLSYDTIKTDIMASTTASFTNNFIFKG